MFVNVVNVTYFQLTCIMPNMIKYKITQATKHKPNFVLIISVEVSY